MRLRLCCANTAHRRPIGPRPGLPGPPPPPSTAVDQPAAGDTTRSDATLSRRQLLLGVATTSTALALQRAQPASAAEQLVAPVRPALSPQQYLDRIRATRDPAFRQLGQLLDSSKYKEAAEALVIYPFDDVAQSSFYLPWAILSRDEDRAAEVQNAYLAFEGKRNAFESVCRRAARYTAEDEEVVEALYQLSSALDNLVASASSG